MPVPVKVEEGTTLVLVMVKHGARELDHLLPVVAEAVEALVLNWKMLNMHR
jgi:hypothetical protein